MSVSKVAKMAGVSTATVSRALNNSPLVNPATARQVREVAEQIGYQLPVTRSVSMSAVRGNRFGRAFVRKRLIAVVAMGRPYKQWIGSPIIGHVVSGLTQAAHEIDKDIILEECAEPESVSRIARRKDLGGAVLLVDSAASCRRDWVQAIEDLAEQMPVVWVMGPHTNRIQIDRVIPDNPGIGQMAIGHLYDEGCRRVAMVTGSPQRSYVRQRLMMYTGAWNEAGLDTRTYLASEDPAAGRAYAGDVSVYDSLENIVDALVGDGFKPDGLFCPQDTETTRLYPLLTRAGLRPQVDIQIVTCGDEQAQQELMVPCPTMIDVNPSLVAQTAIRRLRARMRNHFEPPVLIGIQPKLVEAEVVQTN